MHPIQRCSPILQYPSQEPTAYDEELLGAAMAGSHSAFTELQNLYARRLYNRIFSITRNREDAEDALQEALFHAFRALPSFEGRSRFSSWLTRIAINCALMTIRRRRARPEISLEQPASQGDDDGLRLEVLDTALNPEETYDQKQRSAAILKAIRRLDPKLRIPMRIWMSDERPMKDLAQDLDISLAAVKSRLHRARKHLVRSQALRDRRRGPVAIDRATSNAKPSHSDRKAAAPHPTPIPKYRPFSESQPSRCESLSAD